MSDTLPLTEPDDLDSLKIDTVLNARYKILSVLAKGGAGTVYQGRDLNFLDSIKLVAIKEQPAYTYDASTRTVTTSNAQREMNVIAMLSRHASVPHLLDFFERNNNTYIVMEFINGVILEEIIAKTKELPIEKVFKWAIEICALLNHMHSIKPEPLIHRDIKPVNIMITSAGNIKLMDFHIAKSWRRTAKHTMIGTQGYAAPEMYSGNVEPRSDIFCLGATLHHILTHKDPRTQAPFSFGERPIAKYYPGSPEKLNDVVFKALNYKPDDRYQNAAEMKTDLETAQTEYLAEKHKGTVIETKPRRTKRIKARSVFMSHCEQDKVVMRRLRKTLNDARLNILTSEENEKEAVTAAGALVILCTPDSFKSERVREEMLIAEKHDIKVFPLLLRGTESEAIPEKYDKWQRIELGNEGDYWKHTQLLAHILTAHLIINPKK